MNERTRAVRFPAGRAPEYVVVLPGSSQTGVRVAACPGMTSEIGSGSALLRCTVSDESADGTVSSGPGAVTGPHEVKPAPHSAYPHIGIGAPPPGTGFVVVPACNQTSAARACVAASGRAASTSASLAPRRVSSVFLVMVVPSTVRESEPTGASMMSIVIMPPGKMSSLVTSFSLWECHMWK